MSLANYGDLISAITNWTGRSDINADVVTLFEGWANRKLRVRAQETTTTISMAVSVTGAANNGSGLIRLTVTSTSNFSTGDIRVVQSVLGTTEANGTWTITVIDSTHIDLQNSTFTNAYISGGGVVLGSGPLPSDYLAWKMVRWPGNQTTGTDLRILEYVHPNWLNAAYPTTPSDTPRVFTIEGSTLYTMPQDSSTLTFLYYAKIPSLQTNTTNWLMTAHPDFYLVGCLHEAYQFMLDAEKAILFKEKRDEMYDEIQHLDHSTNAPSAIRIMGAIV